MQFTGSLVCRETGRVVVERLEIADGFWSRFAGLQFRKSLPQGNGLLLVPCSSVHTFFMRFPIDVLILDDKGRVLEVRQNLPPWRMFIPKTKPFAILELPAATAGITPGTTLRFHPSYSGPLSSRVKFLQSDCNNTGCGGVL